ncbi:MAG: hemerythrin domain-containing protein [Myxococcales bacterium]|nr:hemerythrin domain-containing protein [Myxococcales bacterium]
MTAKPVTPAAPPPVPHVTVEDAIADWIDRPVGEVIDHILSRYHGPARRQLGELRALAAAAAIDGALADKLALFDEELTQHMVKEERVAFQMLRAAGGHVGVAMRVMEHEHVLIDRLLAELRDALPVGADGPPGRAQLAILLAEIEADLAPHAALEEILFAGAKAR